MILKTASITLFSLITSILSYAQINPSNVTIARDTFGVPHIFGKTDADVVYGIAYAHCEDDFDNFQQMLLVSRGRLGELKGPNGAAADYFFHFIRAKKTIDDNYNIQLSENFRNILESYAQGINAYAQSHKKEIKLSGLFPITGKDVVRTSYIILSSMVGTATALKYVIDGKPDEYIFNPGMGSNAFAISKERSKDNSTYLVINPHVPLDGTISWWEAHVNSDEGWNFYGSFFPLMTGPAMGANDNLGWGVTFNWPDYVDIYRMELNPKNKNQYLFDGKWEDFERSKVKLKAKTALGKIGVKKEVLWCKYGPAYRTPSGVYALRYNVMGNIKALEEWFMMSHAKDLQEFQQALKMHSIPLFNFVYADKNNNIGHFFNGILPQRNGDYNWQKTLQGNTSKTLWEELIPQNKMPFKINPSCGFIYNTNNTPWRNTCDKENLKATDFDTLSGWHWNRENCRDDRFRELIDGYAKLDLNDIKRIKYDQQYPKKEGGIHKAVKPIYSLDEKKYPEIADAIKLLKQWDYTASGTNTQAPLLLHTFYKLFKLKKAAYVEMETGFTYTEKELVSCIKKSRRLMLKNFKRLDVPLNEVQVITRDGKYELPISGGPDLLCPSYDEPYKKGKLKITNGDTFIMFVKYNKDGASFETVVPFGSSHLKTSRHYTDQMKMYSMHQTKKISLNKLDILPKAERIYHPY